MGAKAEIRWSLPQYNSSSSNNGGNLNNSGSNINVANGNITNAHNSNGNIAGNITNGRSSLSQSFVSNGKDAISKITKAQKYKRKFATASENWKQSKYAITR